MPRCVPHTDGAVFQLLRYGHELNRSEGVGFSYGRVKITSAMYAPQTTFEADFDHDKLSHAKECTAGYGETWRKRP